MQRLLAFPESLRSPIELNCTSCGEVTPPPTVALTALVNDTSESSVIGCITSVPELFRKVTVTGEVADAWVNVTVMVVLWLMADIRVSPILPWSIATASLSLYLRFQSKKFGTAIITNRLMIPTMIMISTRVKPPCALSRVAIPACRDFITLYIKQSGCLGDRLSRYLLIFVLIPI